MRSAPGPACRFEFSDIWLREQLGALVLRMVEELLRRVRLDDLALVHEHDAVGDLPGEAHLVGDDQHGHAVLGELHHGVEHLLDHLGSSAEVGSSNSMIFGIHAERARDRDALLLAARELARILGGLVRDLDPREIVSSPPPRPRCLGILRTQIGASVRFSSTVRCGNRLKCWNTMPTSRRTSSIFFDVVGQLGAVDDDAALLVLLEPVDAADHGRLAGARRPADHDALAACRRAG